MDVVRQPISTEGRMVDSKLRPQISQSLLCISFSSIPIILVQYLHQGLVMKFVQSVTRSLVVFQVEQIDGAYSSASEENGVVSRSTHLSDFCLATEYTQDLVGGHTEHYYQAYGVFCPHLQLVSYSALALWRTLEHMQTTDLFNLCCPK